MPLIHLTIDSHDDRMEAQVVLLAPSDAASSVVHTMLSSSFFGWSASYCLPGSCHGYYCSCLQEALTRVSNGTVHYSSARTLNSTEQPLFAATARALSQSAAPYTVSCYKRIYPETSVRLDTEQALKGLKELIQSWDQERSQLAGKLAQTCGIGTCIHAEAWCQ